MRITWFNLSVIPLLCSFVSVCAVVGIALAEDGKDHTTPKLNLGGIDQPGGTIKGVVKWEGKKVRRKPVRVSADKFCQTAHHRKPLLHERWVFGDNDTLQNVFVWVSKGLEGKSYPAPAQKAVLDQKGCQYVPHVSGVVVNQPLTILSSDNTLHNVNCRPKRNKPFNEAMPLADMAFTKTFTKPEMAIQFKCDVHRWMKAYVHVVEHPFFAVTQQDGTFEIRGLPPGEYELSVWHEFAVFAPDKPSVKVTIAEGQTAQVTFTYSPRKKK